MFMFKKRVVKGLLLGLVGLLLLSPVLGGRAQSETWIEIVPPQPTSEDEIEVHMGGTWPNSCVPSFPEVEITDADGDGDGEILIETFGTLVVPRPPKEAECAQGETEWRLEVPLGRLRPGEYCVTVTYKVHPLAAPEEIARICFYVVPVLITVCPQGPPQCDFSSIQEAIDAARPGDMITVGPGTYEENLVIEKPLTLRGAGPDRTTVVGHIVDWPSAVISIRAESVRVEGFTITGTGLYPIGVWVRGDDVHIVGNRIIDVEFGVEVTGDVMGVEVTRNEILRCFSCVSVAHTSANPVLIVENTISECLYGIALGVVHGALGGDASAKVMRNTISRNQEAGIGTFGAIAEISSNVIEENSGPGLLGAGGSSLTIRGNLISRNGEEGVRFLNDDVVLLLQNTVAENGADGLALAVKFAQVAGNHILSNGGNGISILSPGRALGVIVGDRGGGIFTNVIEDNDGYGIFAEDASLVLSCEGNELSGNKLGDFSENLEGKCKEAI
jgi:nitrous oxidase accessory protein NosD